MFNNKFGDFLYELRKEKGMTQSQLADKLGLTNKAISKWETGEAYPDTAHLVPLAKIFSITVDELLNGARRETNHQFSPEEEMKLLKPMTKTEIRGAVTGISLIMTGALILIVLALANVSYGLYVSILLAFVSAGVFIIMHSANKRKVRSGELSSEDEAKGVKIGLNIAIGVGIVIFSIIPLVALSAAGFSTIVYLPPFLAIAIIGVIRIIISGMMYSNFSREHNLPTESEKVTKKALKIEETVCSVIMLTATAVFFLLGFIFNYWHPGWAVFPVGGILCAISSVIVRGKFDKE
ncbi:MAG: helix-turn-helix domain-containing protein [Bacillota bacterium]